MCTDRNDQHHPRQEGVTRYITEVRAYDIGFLQPKEAAPGAGDEAA
jgi:hypothetical protein